ncbi:ras-related protein Rab-24-like isoform X2 [Gigantopelta aegis]|uniref:ras-related protein Rab-24-like isoform X2 n=1 Tax=Gigantopelta aegis TaxID=1735272 RepID=UPI001B88D297|nr:ras-related protein Rab-24-like isoform X2 [Gigantopelta aegis]
MSGSKVDVKVVLLGKSYAGKTSLVERYIRGHFTGDTVAYQNTIGAAFGAKKVEIGKKTLTLGIWDTAGSERYEAMSRIYYRGAAAAILCFDLTDKSSFDRARFWIGELRAKEESCKIYLCGTKCDLIESDPDLRNVDEQAAKALAMDVMAELYETSSKTGKNINELFLQIAKDYLNSTKPPTPGEHKESFILRDWKHPRSCMCKGS